jgi:hypothetical protein
VADGLRRCLCEERTQIVAQLHDARSDAGLDRAEGLPELGGDLGVAQARIIGQVDDLPLLGGQPCEGALDEAPP